MSSDVKLARGLNSRAFLLAGCVAFLAAGPSARALDLISGSETATAVSSKVYNGYERRRGADGSFLPETYALGNGGFIFNRLGTLETGVPFQRDDSIDAIDLSAVAAAIQDPLASQAYEPARDPGKTDLFIMVFWGLTVGGGDLASGRDRDKVDLENAALLGFGEEGVLAQGFGDPSNVMAHIKRQVHSGVMSALEANRYYVVLRAFDFQEAWKRKKIRLLWETRFSLTQRRHDFGLNLPTMAQIASKYFGQDSHGLIQKSPPEGRVDIGEPRAIGDGAPK
jgi:hypothetical protein